MQLQNETIVEMNSFDPTRQPHIPSNDYWKSIDFSYLELEEDDIKLQHLTGVQILNLTGWNSAVNVEEKIET